MDLSKIFDKTIGGWGGGRWCWGGRGGCEHNSNSLHFCKLRQQVFFCFKAQMLELHKSFLLVKFFNQISCNKGLKAKLLCFFSCFFLFNPPEAGKFKLQKDHFVLDVTQAEEIQKSTSTELHECTENVVNVENCNFLKVNCRFLSVI